MAREKQGIPLGEYEWLLFAAIYSLTGVATTASYFSAIIASTKSLPQRHSGLGEFLHLLLLSIALTNTLQQLLEYLPPYLDSPLSFSQTSLPSSLPALRTSSNPDVGYYS